MWPLKKKKGFSIAPGGGMSFEIPIAWRKDKKEVAIITENGPIILDEKSELFIEIIADNTDPIKVQVIPDFRKKILNFVEIIDPNVKKKFTDKNGPKLKVTGIAISRNINFGEFLKNWDKNIDDFDKNLKKLRRSSSIYISILIILALVNLYIFITKNDNSRYLSLIATFVAGFGAYYLWSLYKKVYKDYKDYKESREKVFDIVKEK